MSNIKFKPQLLPNNKVGETPDWESRIANPLEWLYSNKLDGARVEIFWDGRVLGRSLKPIPNVHIKRMVADIALALQLPEGTIIEAEFYSPNMTFSEIMHFFKTEDVTSIKTRTKYEKLWNKTGGDPSLGWTYPGRSVEWLTTWHKSLKFYAFNFVNVTDFKCPMITRIAQLELIVEDFKESCNVNQIPTDLVSVRQNSFTSIDELYQAYDQAILDGHEGLVVMHKQSQYKCGRHTLNSKQAFKIKEDNLQFDGVILDVEEGTVAREGAEKTVNELGRSVTSKLKEDRVPSGMAKGFFVDMEDGRELTVSLTGYSHEERRDLLENRKDYIGRSIRFTGMAPVKEGGCPRHAHFEKGNFRDDK